MFESIPAVTETREFRPDWSGKPSREIESRWVISPEGHPEKVVVDLTTTHSTDSKRFSTRITWGTVSSENGFSVYSWASDHAYVTVHTASVERYSKKAIQAHHAEAVQIAEDYFDQGVGKVFDEAAEKTGLNEKVEV